VKALRWLGWALLAGLLLLLYDVHAKEMRIHKRGTASIVREVSQWLLMLLIGGAMIWRLLP